ncbi:MAG TPA: NHLP bacteriocin system secretion protein [Gammaproteobacteria bacterium]|nr:NHLP bacteriocin system secretion protein [Gammaproteobacteria bacterium]
MQEELETTKASKLKFRQEALLELHTPDQIDKLIEVVSPKAWIMLLSFYMLLISLIVWVIFGSIPTRVEGKGILLVENGSVYNAVAPPGGGQIADILVQQEQEIKKGDIIARLERPDLTEKLQLAKNYVEQLKREQEELSQTSKKELAIRHEKISQQISMLDSSLASGAKNLKDIETLLNLKEENFKKGILIWQDIENTRRDYYSAKDRLEQLQNQITQLKTQEDDFKDQWRQRLKDKELTILAEQLKMNNMAAEVTVSKTVVSPADGIVISVNTSVGKMVPDGGSVVTITSLGEGLDALIFMLPHEGQRVTPEMPALITPTTIEKEEYGSMKGKVLSVSEFPQAAETIIALLHNQEMAKQFVESGAPTGIRIRITRDPNTFSGYQWSSSKGPNKKISPGTLAEVRITVREQPPISLVIPAFKKLLGVS